MNVKNDCTHKLLIQVQVCLNSILFKITRFKCVLKEKEYFKEANKCFENIFQLHTINYIYYYMLGTFTCNAFEHTIICVILYIHIHNATTPFIKYYFSLLFIQSSKNIFNKNIFAKHTLYLVFVSFLFSIFGTQEKQVLFTLFLPKNGRMNNEWVYVYICKTSKWRKATSTTAATATICVCVCTFITINTYGRLNI